MTKYFISFNNLVAESVTVKPFARDRYGLKRTRLILSYKNFETTLNAELNRLHPGQHSMFKVVSQLAESYSAKWLV